MKNRYTLIYLLVALGGLMALLSLLVFAFFPTIQDRIVELVRDWGYLAILATSFFTDLIMQPIGPDIPLIGGLVVGLNPLVCFIMAGTGSFTASMISFSLAKYLGQKEVSKAYYHKGYDRYKKLFTRYGRVSLTLAAVTPLPFVPFCWFAGIFGMKIKDYMIFGIIPRMLRFAGVIVITVIVLNIVK